MLFVYLLDPLVTIGDPRKYTEINRILQGHFNKVAIRLRPADTIRVACIPATPSPATRDIVIYFAPVECSVVGLFAGRARDPMSDDGDVFTFIKTAAGV